jgi:hypothetical protein
MGVVGGIGLFCHSSRPLFAKNAKNRRFRKKCCLSTPLRSVLDEQSGFDEVVCKQNQQVSHRFAVIAS